MSAADRHWNRPAEAPLPVLDATNTGLFRAAAEGRLDIQRCKNCTAHRYPPAALCHRCNAAEWEWSTLSGLGAVYSYSWVPDRDRSQRHDRPVFYNVAVVELDGAEPGPVRMMTNVVDAWEPGDLRVGDMVEVVGVPVGEGIALPCFRKVDARD